MRESLDICWRQCHEPMRVFSTIGISHVACGALHGYRFVRVWSTWHLNPRLGCQERCPRMGINVAYRNGCFFVGKVIEKGRKWGKREESRGEGERDGDGNPQAEGGDHKLLRRPWWRSSILRQHEAEHGGIHDGITGSGSAYMSRRCSDTSRTPRTSNWIRSKEATPLLVLRWSAREPWLMRRVFHLFFLLCVCVDEQMESEIDERQSKRAAQWPPRATTTFLLWKLHITKASSIKTYVEMTGPSFTTASIAHSLNTYDPPFTTASIAHSLNMYGYHKRAIFLNFKKCLHLSSWPISIWFSLVWCLGGAYFTFLFANEDEESEFLPVAT